LPLLEDPPPPLPPLLVEQAAASNATAATVTASRAVRPVRLPVEVCISDTS
jgi:hypothetical protein